MVFYASIYIMRTIVSTDIILQRINSKNVNKTGVRIFAIRKILLQYSQFHNNYLLLHLCNNFTVLGDKSQYQKYIFHIFQNLSVFFVGKYQIKFSELFENLEIT